MSALLDPFNLLPEIKAGKKKPIHQSTIGQADTCHKRLEFDLDPSIGYTNGSQRAVGTGYHAALELYYENDGSVTRDAMLSAAIAAFDREVELTPEENWSWDEKAPDRDTALGLMGTMICAYVDGAHAWPLDEFKVLYTEATIILPLHGDWVVRGTLDLVLEDSNGWHVLVDHKTANRPWAKDKHLPAKTNQPSWYQKWWPQTYAITHGGEIPQAHFVFDVMTYDGNFKRIPAPRRPLDLEIVVEKAELVTDLIDRGGPFLPNTQSFLCSEKWCDHWFRCPFGARMQDSTGVMAST